MIFNKEGNTTIVFQENISLDKFIVNLEESYESIKQDHLVVNLFSFDTLNANHVLEFLELSNKHRSSRKSFVIVTKKVSYDEVPDEICLVPTIQEAKDFIEMEEIERDLEL